MLNRPSPHAEAGQLRAGDQSLLPSREPTDLAIGPAHPMVNVPREPVLTCSGMFTASHMVDVPLDLQIDSTGTLTMRFRLHWPSFSSDRLGGRQCEAFLAELWAVCNELR